MVLDEAKCQFKEKSNENFFEFDYMMLNILLEINFLFRFIFNYGLLHMKKLFWKEFRFINR